MKKITKKYTEMYKEKINGMHKKILEKTKKFKEEELGSVTAEYSFIALCAVAFAGILLGIIKSDVVKQMILGIITQALEVI